MINHLILNSLWIFGFWTLFTQGMIFAEIHNSAIKALALSGPTDRSWILKPVWGCPPCMASIHGTIGFFLCEYDITYMPLYLVALTGLNSIVNMIIHK